MNKKLIEFSLHLVIYTVNVKTICGENEHNVNKI